MNLFTPPFGMVPLSITSLQHPIVKEFVKIRKNLADTDLALVQNQKVICELSSTYRLHTLILQNSLNPAEFPPADHIYLVTEAIIKKITGLATSDGAIAAVKKPGFTDLSHKQRLLVLDHIYDPGNLGTLLRTALALEYDGVYFIGGVSPFNDKALRAAKGATFHLPLQTGSSADFMQFLEKTKLQAILAALHGQSLATYKPKQPFALVLGSEASGCSLEIAKACIPVTIPMSEKSESLNVAVAGGIFLYALVR